MQCLITAFDPFDGMPVNPSQQAVEQVTAQILGTTAGKPIDVTKLILPTCCDEAWATLRNRVAELAGKDKFVLIMSGFAKSATKIRLERYALNARHYRIADNQGHQWLDTYIEKDGPAAFSSELNLKQMEEALIAEGIHCEVSYHAGT